MHLLYALIHDLEPVELGLLHPELGRHFEDKAVPALLGRVVALAKHHLASIERLRGSDKDVFRSASEVILVHCVCECA